MSLMLRNLQTSNNNTDTHWSHSVCSPLRWLVYLIIISHYSCCLVSWCLSRLASLCSWCSWLAVHVFGDLVVVCDESQINTACCHMRNWGKTSNTEQMDTSVWSLEKYFPLMLQTLLLLSVREWRSRVCTEGKTQRQSEGRVKPNVNKKKGLRLYFDLTLLIIQWFNASIVAFEEGLLLEILFSFDWRCQEKVSHDVAENTKTKLLPNLPTYIKTCVRVNRQTHRDLERQTPWATWYIV